MGNIIHNPKILELDSLKLAEYFYMIRERYSVHPSLVDGYMFKLSEDFEKFCKAAGIRTLDLWLNDRHNILMEIIKMKFN